MFKNRENSLIFKMDESFSGLCFFIPLSSARFLNCSAEKTKTKMKTLFTLILVLLTGITAFSQDTHAIESQLKQVPSVNLQDINGKSVNTAAIGVEGPVIISFWATWCAPCKKELNTIHELYEDWQAETGVTLVAVSIDDEKTKSQVPVYVNGKAWDYIVLMDPNGDFKRAMGVNNVPHTFLVDKDGNIVYSHNNFAPGDEEKLYKELLHLSGK